MMDCLRVAPFVPSSLWVILLFAPGALSDAACYFPDGIEASDNTPCSQSADPAICCGPGFSCLSNGLCSQGGLLFRGTCTDSTWKSRNCPRFCMEGGELDNYVQSCPGLGSGRFCCQLDGQDCCSNSTLILSLGSGTVIGTTTTATTTTSRPTTSVAVTTWTTTTTTTTGTAMPGDTVSTRSGSPTPYTTAPSQSSGTNVGVAAGVGVGVGLPVCVGLAVFCYFFLRRRRYQQNNPQKVVPGAEIHELAQKDMPSELASPSPMAELPSAEARS